MKTYRLEVSGRVQGVFFRVNVKNIADNLKIRGNVKNLENGNVLIYCQCSDEKLRDLIKEIENSPGLSKVENVSKSITQQQEFKEFTILREKNFLRDKKKALRNLSRKILKL